MAPSLPVIDGSRCVRTFEKFGWTVARRKGSHIIMTKPGHRATLSIPDHDPVAKGTLRSFIRAAGLSVDQFVEAAE
jgi:predicted RNA binding protein YcfA (HicA-like mRNA interferase family)